MSRKSPPIRPRIWTSALHLFLRHRLLWLLLVGLVAGPSACGADKGERSLEVTATAYTLRPAETSATSPGVGAWGDELDPDMRAIAVSRDLINRGLDHGTEVRIDGLPGLYVVRDKMAARWEEKIDILMGDIDRALAWGEQEVTIHWTPTDDG